MTENPERQRFNPTGFAMVLTLFVFSAASFVAPGYADVGDPWRWIMYAIGVLSYLLGCVGITVVVGNAYGGVEGFRLSVYVLGLFTLASALHLSTVYVPMPGWLLTALRLCEYILVLPLSLLTVFRIIGALRTSEHRTEAVLALLALLGALLPIVISLIGAPQGQARGLYSPAFREGGFSELRLYGVRRTSPVRGADSGLRWN